MNKKHEEIRSILAQNIKKRRELLGLSQEKLAEAAGLSVQTINTIEGCRMWVSDKTITRIAQVLNIEIFQLFVPYSLNKHKFTESNASVLLGLRKTIMGDLEQLNAHIDSRFNDALKSPLHHEKKESKEPAIPARDKPRRAR